MVADPPSVFVGRGSLIEELAAALPRGVLRMADMIGIVGVGKTELLKHVAKEFEARHNAVRLRINIDNPSPPANTSESWDLFNAKLGDAAKALEAAGFRRAARDFDNEALKVKQHYQPPAPPRNVKFGDRARLVHAIGVNLVYGDAIMNRIASDRAGALGQAFGEFVEAITIRRPAVIVVDGFEATGTAAAGTWFLDVFRRLTNTLVLIARTPPTELAALDEEALQRQVGPFTLDEVAALLAARAGDEPVPPQIADAVWRWSEGHAFTADVGARLWAGTRERDVVEFERRLETLPPDERRDKVALAIVPRDLHDIARACAVARRFDCALVEKLADLTEPSDAVVERLLRAGVAERVGEPGDHLFRLHSFVRVPLEQASLDDERLRELHTRAADHYYAEVTRDEEALPDDARGYDAWYRYEDPRWQTDVREWLYHQRHAARDSDDPVARVRFARVFLDAFWWWGCYIDFPFCWTLIADWEVVRPDDRAWTEALRSLLERYPTGYRKTGAAGWPDVAIALAEIERAAGVDGRVRSLESDDERRVRALIDVFRAHAARYGGGSYNLGVKLYEEADALLETLDDDWSRSWLAFELAELHLEQGDRDRARTAWTAARDLELASDEPDEELRANLHRARADAVWQTAPTDAFAAHGRAVLHAYRFHVASTQRRPDPYTRAFHVEQMERAVERLIESGAGDVAEAARRLREPFGLDDVDADALRRLVAQQDAVALEALLFPAPPTNAELYQTASPFTHRWDEIMLFARDAAETDLEEVEPWPP